MAVVIGALALLAPCREALAQKTSAQARAAELFKRSADEYKKGNFQATVKLLDEAYALDPQPVLVYNLGRAYEGLGDLTTAIAAYEKYLHDDPKTADRGALEHRIATLRRERDEKVALARQRDEERERADEQRRAAEDERRARGGERAPEERGRSPGPYVLAGVGVAGLAAGAAFGIMAASTHDAAVAERVQKVAVEEQDEAKRYATVSSVAFVAGGVLVAAGVTWWILDTPKKREGGGRGARVGVGVGPSSVSLEGSF